MIVTGRVDSQAFQVSSFYMLLGNNPLLQQLHAPPLTTQFVREELKAYFALNLPRGSLI